MKFLCLGAVSETVLSHFTDRFPLSLYYLFLLENITECNALYLRRMFAAPENMTNINNNNFSPLAPVWFQLYFVWSVTCLTW
jgi:hypothetical protein